MNDDDDVDDDDANADRDRNILCCLLMCFVCEGDLLFEYHYVLIRDLASISPLLFQRNNF